MSVTKETTSNKKLLETSATLVVTGALLVTGAPRTNPTRRLGRTLRARACESCDSMVMFMLSEPASATRYDPDSALRRELCRVCVCVSVRVCFSGDRKRHVQDGDDLR